MLASLLAACAPGEETVDLDAISECHGPAVDLGAPLDGVVPAAEFVRLAATDPVLTPTASGKAVNENSGAAVDYSNARDGYVMVKWKAGGTPKLKVLIKGPTAGKGVYDSYQYNPRTDGEYEVFPLSDGSGKYSIGIYKNTTGTQYATILTANLDVRLSDEFTPFLRPNQYVTCASGSETIKKAAEVCEGAETNLEKVEKINVWSETEGWIEGKIYFDGKEWRRGHEAADGRGCGVPAAGHGRRDP